MLGFQPKELSAQFAVWREHLHPEDAQEVLKAFYDHIEGRAPYYEALHRMIAKKGKVTWVLDRGRVSEWDEQGNALKVTGTHIDMTKEKQYEAQLSALAHHDPLTGLTNRHALQHLFSQMKKQGPLCLAYIDLDNFKHVNDTLGHRSGDEFVLLLPYLIGYPKVRIAAQAVLDAALTPFELGNGLAQIGASVGIAQVQESDDFGAALTRADEAMYNVKHNGKQGFGLAETE